MIHGIGRPYRGETPFYEVDYEEIEAFLLQFINAYPYKKKEFIEYVDKEEL